MKTIHLLLFLTHLILVTSSEFQDSESQNLDFSQFLEKLSSRECTFFEIVLIVTGKIQKPNCQMPKGFKNSEDVEDSEGYQITDPELLQDIDEFNFFNSYSSDRRDFSRFSGLLRLIFKTGSKIGLTLRKIFMKVGRVVAVGRRILKSVSGRSMEMIRSIGTKFKGDGHVPKMLDRVGDVVDVVERVGDKVISRSMQYGETDEGMGLMYSVQEGEDEPVEQGFLPADKNPMDVIFGKEKKQEK